MSDYRIVADKFSTDLVVQSRGKATVTVTERKSTIQSPLFTASIRSVRNMVLKIQAKTSVVTLAIASARGADGAQGPAGPNTPTRIRAGMTREYGDDIQILFRRKITYEEGSRLKLGENTVLVGS